MISIISGVFYDRGEEVYIQNPDGDTNVKDVVSQFSGEDCEVHLHYMPKSSSLLGGGSCLWGPTCPVHKSRPDWVLHFQSEGVLNPSFMKIGGKVIPLDLMDGHYGRLIIFRNPKVCKNDYNYEDLLEEASHLESLLSGLKEIL